MRFYEDAKNNPQNPANIQIPFAMYMLIDQFITQTTDPNSLTPDEKAACDHINYWMMNKAATVLNRQAYKKVVQAQSSEERQAALVEYHDQKEWGKVVDKYMRPSHE